ncbi:MAG: LysM peptidoglycan-binding domain-containing protein [Halofilum sp. (in: g-proteobacteria)]|nr:LysM peptidoglycan-binding domain-containing protein [Halofilum sp. (in: g-proteobacteria)]
MKRLCLALLCWCALVTPLLAAPGDLPRPQAIRPAVEFWTRVYTEVDTNAGLIHDRDNLGVVYEAVRLDPQGSRRSRIDKVRERKAHYRDILLDLARGDRANMTPEQREVLKLWPEGVSNQRLRQAARGIRFQLGQSDKFRAGLVRSGAWEPHIRRTLEEMGLPEELAALPHVESSFNPDAYSRVGAAGLWQFTRSTGRRYMRVDHVVDERMDPFTASIAAARLLQHNYSVTKDWALALTAYNHGLAGIRRAVRTVGSSDIADLIEYYNGRTWGFASRNFYPAFLAAVEVDFNAEEYFGDVERREQLHTETVELPFYAPVDALVRAFGIDRNRLRELNRALRGPIWDGTKRVPRGYELRIPREPDRPAPEQLLARVDKGQRFYAQVPDRYHRVQRGEALSTIASRYGASVRELMALNNLRSANFIRAGQRLRLPVPEGEGVGRSLAQDAVYTVRRGDTLSGIAARAGIRTSTLVALNDIGNVNTIQPGQQLRLRGEIVTAEATATEAPATDETVVAEADETRSATGSSGDSADAETAAAPDAAPADGETTDARIADTEIAAAETATATADEQPGSRSERAPSRGVGDGRRLAADTGSGIDAVMTSGETVKDETETVTDEDVSSGAVAEEAPTLAADPADYSVASDATIEIQAAETLGHYAEWLDLRASQLRRINDMRYGKPVVVGKRLKLDFSRVDPGTFEQRRREYHELIQARFFEQFRITGTREAIVRTGDSLWTLSRRMNNVPVWLLRQYNPDLDFDALHPGNRVTVPVLERQPSAGDSEDDSVDVAENQAAE